MKLQKQPNRKVKGKEYYRWAVVIPPSTIESLGWKEDQELEPKVQGKKLIIEPSSKV